MSSYSTNEFRSGLKIMIDGDPYVIVENEFVKPGKGQAFNRVRIRNLKSGRTLERNMKSGDTVEAADIARNRRCSTSTATATSGTSWCRTTSSSTPPARKRWATRRMWLKDGTMCTVMLWNGVPLSVNAPAHVELKIVETDPGVRGDTATGGQKPAKLETGAVVRVPLFLNEGEVIRVDTRTGEYLSRAKS